MTEQENIRKQSELTELIQQLGSKELKEQDYNDVVKRFVDIYDCGWRHSYGTLTQYFFNNVDKDVLRDVLLLTSENILSLLHRNEFEDETYKRTRRSLEKLKDHLDLELIRVSFFESQFEQLDKRASFLESKSFDIQNTANDFTAKIKQHDELLNKQKTESVTVLGIFASIVVTFVGGASLSAAIFSNMHKVDTPLLCFLTVLIIGFISNLVFQLFNFLRRINGLDGPNTPLKWYNIALSVVSISCLVWQCIDSACW